MKPQSVRIGVMKTDEVPDEILARLNSGFVSVCDNGMIYTRTGSKILCCENSEAGKAFIREMDESRDDSIPTDPLLRLLHGDNSSGIIREGILRCVIVFREAAGQGKKPDREILEELIPMENGDALTEINGEIVLIKQTDGPTDEEVTEFTAAVIDTAETEAGIRLQAGIGRMTRCSAQIKDSFEEAESAIRMGQKFLPRESVYAYGHLAAERLLSAVPSDECTKLRKELFTPETEKLLGREMMETIDAFFRNDLNLSTTAREMFIHRNTLIYRLDKIRKVTGYDLRHFQDAVSFRLLSRLHESEE